MRNAAYRDGIRVAGVVACSLACAWAAHGQGRAGGQHASGAALDAGKDLTREQAMDAQQVRVRLKTDAQSVRPGEEFLLGIEFQIREGWHIYWPGQSDTGTSPQWKLTLPEGWIAGEASWDVPRRYESAGEILDHVYEGTTVVLVPVRVAGGAETAVETAARIQIDAEWLVCKDVCIPEEGSATLDLTMSPQSPPPPQRGALRAMWNARPRIWGQPGAALTDSDVQIRWEGTTLEAQWLGDASALESMAFMPGVGSDVAEDLLTQGQSADGLLRLRFKRQGELGEKVSVAISGLLVVQDRPKDNSDKYLRTRAVWVHAREGEKLAPMEPPAPAEIDGSAPHHPTNHK